MPATDTPNRPCVIRVVVREDNDPDAIIHDKTADHNDRYFRDWVTKTTWWALRNGKTVSMYPVSSAA
jgi:hypothetical protein